MNDIIKIVKSLKDSGLLLKGVTKTVQNEVKEPKGGFLSMLLSTLGASLLGNHLTGKGEIATSQGRGIYRTGKGKGINRAGYGNNKKIDFMLTGKKLTDYTNLFSPYDFKKNNNIILRYFKYE